MKNCNTCAYCIKISNENRGCSLTQLKIDPKKDYCSKYQHEIIKCKNCGQWLIPGVEVYIWGEDPDYYCGNCMAQIGTCKTCKENNHCAFHEDQTTPDYVMRTVRQGNMTLQTQGINFEKQEIRCPDCKCWSAETKKCMRQELNCCSQWSDK